MSGSFIGNHFKVTTWGESHGKAIGAVIDGCPAGLELTESDIQPYLDRRRPGKSRYATARKETDQVSILSGTFEGRTTGTPISLLVENTDQHSKDYTALADLYRPGHADYGYDVKYGFRDYRGGGRSSGRETIGRVAAGAVAAKLLAELGISFQTYTESIGPVYITQFDSKQIPENPFCMPDAAAAEKAAGYLEECMEHHDSSGGTVICRVSGVPAGLGEPVFQKLDAALAGAVFSIGAVKGVEIGDGFRAASARGSENNDAFCYDKEICKKSNHAGGILGGISDGSDIILRAAFKPTPSISQEQQTVGKDGRSVTITIGGRHDPVIVPRAVVVVEAMVAIILADHLLIGMSSKLENVKQIYR